MHVQIWILTIKHLLCAILIFFPFRLSKLDALVFFALISCFLGHFMHVQIKTIMVLYNIVLHFLSFSSTKKKRGKERERIVQKMTLCDLSLQSVVYTGPFYACAKLIIEALFLPHWYCTFCFSIYPRKYEERKSIGQKVSLIALAFNQLLLGLFYACPKFVDNSFCTVISLFFLFHLSLGGIEKNDKGL